MARRLRFRAPAIGLVVGAVGLASLATSPLATAAPTTPDVAPSEVGLSAGDQPRVLVDAADRRGLAALRREDAVQLADYGTFSLWQATDAAGLGGVRSVVPRDDLSTIGLRGRELDTSADVPAPSYLAAEPTGPADGPQLRLVQFVGPVQPAWLDDVTATGAELVAYQPANAYVVRADADAAVAIDAMVGQNPAVQYSGPFDPAYRLSPDLVRPARQGGAATVDVTVQVVEDDADSFAEVTGSRRVVQPAYAADGLRTVTVRAARADLDGLAALPGVYNVEPYVAPERLDERQGQLLAGNLTTAGGKTVPSAPGYREWLDDLGFPQDPARYPVVTVVDGGLDSGSATPLHPDLFGGGDPANPDRVPAAGNCTADATGRDLGGHGSINVGIVGGYNDQVGAAHEDADGYQYGLGVSPYGRVSALKIFNDAGSYNVSACGGTEAGIVQRAYDEGAQITSNSWGASVNGAYTAASQAFDRATRDASSSTAGSQEMLHVFAAGNDAGSRTIGSPGTAKNVLTVGATENVREQGVLDGCQEANADSDSDIAGFSSRGPTSDQRAKPEVVAAGTHVVGPASQDPGYDASAVCAMPTDRYRPAGQTRYTWSSGTSHSTPAIAGAASLVQEYYGRALTAGDTASPAMLRALLGNVPRYLTGVGAGGTLPGVGQGWGVPDLGRLFDQSVERTVVDQAPERTFTATGQKYGTTADVARADQPVRVSLAWTDAPGSTTGNSWVNDLDLEVIVGDRTYRGNVFDGALSAPGGTADGRNNLENVFLPAGTTGPVKVRVVARGLNGDGVPGNDTVRDQDFALTTSNLATSDASDAVARPAGLTVADSDDEGADVSPGEVVDVTASVRSDGIEDALPEGSGTLSVVSGPATVRQGSSAFGPIAVDQTGQNATPYEVRVAPYAGCGAAVTLRHTYTAGDQTVTEDTTFRVGVPASPDARYTSYAASGLPLAVPDPGVVTSRQTLPRLGSDAVGDVHVRLDLTHPYVGDVTAVLVSPAGTRTTLVSRRGGAGDNFTGTVFDDAATTAITAGRAPYTGSFRPEQAISRLRGEQLSGTWALEVRDAESPDAGRLVAWSLDVAPLVYASCEAVGQTGRLGTPDPASESDGGEPAVATVPVTLVDRESDGPVSATFTPRSGTATAGEDFVADPVTVVWEAGDPAEKTVSVPLVDDRVTEPEETFELVATGGDATGRATVMILDDDLVPATPAAPTAERGDRSLTVSWTPADGRGSAVTGYTLVASPGGATVTTGGDATSATIDGLTNGTAYTVTLAATNAVGTSEASEPSSAVTPAAVPDRVARPTAERGDTSAVVRWEAAGGNGTPVTGYTVTASPGGATASVGADAREATFEGLTNGTAYTFTVSATSAVGDGPSSEASAAVTPAGVAVWGARPTAVRGDESARVGWTAPDANGAPVTGYTVTASPGGASVTVGGDATRAVVDGLENGTAYTFTVTATNAVGDAVSDPTAETVTPAGVPSAVARPTAVRGDGSADVSWTAPAANGSAIQGYLVTASPGGMSARVDGDATTATVGGLVNGASYTFVVRALNDVGSSAASAASEPVTPAGAPDAPRQVSAVRGDSEATVRWQAARPNGSPVSGYVVTASPGGAQVRVDGGSTSARVPGLTNGTAYTFTVTATNGVGDSEAETAEPVVPAGLPGRVAAPTVTVSGRTATVRWLPAAANGAEVTFYRVESNRGRVRRVPGTRRTVVLGDLGPGRHTFRVTALNAVGSSAPGRPTTVTVRTR